MQNLSKLIENRVKDAIAKASMKLGIDKNEVYYGIGGFGMVGPLIAQNPQTGEQAIVGFKPIWQISIGIRTVLVGQEPIVGGLPIPSVLPTMAEIEVAVTRLLSEVQQIRDQQNSVSRLEVGK